METAFESAIFNSDKDKTLNWYLTPKDRLSALHPDMYDSMINIEILIKCGGELENAIKCRCLEPFSTNNYINAMEDIITMESIGKIWIRNPMQSKIISNTYKEDRRPEIPVLKYHKCGRNSNKANTCTKKTKIN
ncbi:hypothetical protein O181_100247 [Austropuccinia psidii MF-1]|uniref:Uncharacterized protein n=1 Tax=Austropuccinia psidii MF-1 TaxID=1389203 RepID=A0A9Q3JDU4_9BASI|nr:hypothetical protein [Austropuccinia psidii MF-1]